MKKIVIVMIVVIALTGCTMRPNNVRLVLYSNYTTNITLHKYTDDYILEEATLSSPSYSVLDFFSNSSKRDTRKYLYKICKENINTDTLKIYSGLDINIYNGCKIYSIFNNQNSCSSPKAFMKHLKDTNNSNYYELLPNQLCIEIPL